MDPSANGTPRSAQHLPCVTLMNVCRPALLMVALVLVGCAAKRVETARESGVRSPSKKEAARTAETRGDAPEEPPLSLAVGPLFYQLDSARLTDESTAKLNAVADWLRVHPRSTINLSGHTCELGTSEYNLALGNQRAKVARDYLVRLGVPPDRIRTVSYGEERPALEGDGEDVWSRNRRAEFEVSAAEAR